MDAEVETLVEVNKVPCSYLGSKGIINEKDMNDINTDVDIDRSSYGYRADCIYLD